MNFLRKISLLLTFVILTACSKKEDEIISKVNNFMEIKAYKESLETLDKAIAEDKNNKKLHRARILVFLKVGRQDLASAAYKEFSDQVSKNDEVIYDALTNNDSTIRATAAQTLAALQDNSAIPSLIKLIDDSEDNVRRAAIAAIGQLKDESNAAVPALIKALQDKWFLVRYDAAHTLGTIKDARAIAPLFAALEKDSDNSVRRAARNALMTMGKVETQAQYQPFLKHSHPETAHVAALVLASLGDNDAVPHLLPQLQSKDVQTRALTTRALSRCSSDEARASVRRMLKDADLSVRAEAIMGLTSSKDTAALNDIKAIAENKSEDYRLQQLAQRAVQSLSAP